MNPKYIKSDQAYYDVNNNTIYAPEFRKGSYWHELSHYKDHQNKFYRKLSLFNHMTLQVLMMFLPIIFLTSLWIDVIWINFAKLCLPISLFIIQEELRAYYYEWKMDRSFKI